MGRTLNVKDFDLERIFGQEGVQLIHLSGLIAALSPETSTFCLELARAAKKYGTRVSFDLNYRASFWENREDELHGVFTEIASLSDVLIGNEEDYQLSLGIKGPQAGVQTLAKILRFPGDDWPGERGISQYLCVCQYAAEVVDVNSHLWGPSS